MIAAGGDAPDSPPIGIGSVLLLPELLSRPLRLQANIEVAALASLLARLVLVSADREIAYSAAALGVRDSLRAADATHLATAILGGADRFVTNNSKDLTSKIVEINVVRPQHLH